MMKAYIGIIVGLTTSSVTALAVERLNERAVKLTDGEILNYALTLEHLEDKFYREGLGNYTRTDFLRAGFSDSYYNNLKDISSDETEHVKFLTSALKTAGVTPVSECTYDFPSTDPRSFVALSSVLEGVGVSAYLGIAADIIDSAYLTAAGSILSTEARHSAYIRDALSQRPFPAPFDAPLDPNEVNTLASPFIVSCPPPSPSLPLKSFPKLALATPGNVFTGGTITLKTPGYTLKPKNESNTLHGAFITATGPIFVNVVPVEGGFTTKVPGGIAGQNYIVLTRFNNSVTDDTVLAGPAIIEVTN
ncbi:hypothetical protein MMC07_006153 [Pseudocyphellaria aurata]|nr:hypothetical protein [Pseudocyphellaria aurata]